MVAKSTPPPGTKFVSHVLSDGFCPFEHTRFYEVYSAETSRNSSSASPSLISRKPQSSIGYNLVKGRSKSEERPHLTFSSVEIEDVDGTVTFGRRNFLPTTRRRFAQVPKFSAGDTLCSADDLLTDTRANQASSRKCGRSQSVKAVRNESRSTAGNDGFKPDSPQSRQSFSAEAIHNLLQVQILKLKDQILGKSPRSSRKIYTESMLGVNNSSWGSDQNGNEIDMAKLVGKLRKPVRNVCRLAAGYLLYLP